jgi:HAE1 family hydrophobic/amphiphilic exporter-1
MGSEYLGGTEQNKFTAYVELPTGVKLEASDKVVKKVEEIAKQVPEVTNITSRVEGWSSKVYIEVTKSTQRKRTLNEIIESIRQKTDRLQPAFIYFQQEEQVGTKELIIEVFGHNYEKLRELAVAISNSLGKIPGLTDTKIRMREGRPEMQVLVDKKKAGTYTLTTKEIADEIHGQMRGLRATMFSTESTEVETISRLDEKYRKTFKDLHNLIMTPREGDPVLLKQMTDFKFGLGPSEIWRKDKNRVIQVSANLGKVPLSQIAEQVKEEMKKIPFPEDYFWRIAGDYPTMIRANKQLKIMIIFVLVLVYLVLASLFESFYQPFLIMVAVPLALVGAVVALYLGPKTIGVGAMLGMMMLGGIVVNHSIMLIDRVNYYIALGVSTTKATVLANKDRLRPILMTTASTVLGLFPMAIDRSEGANLWTPLALTVIGGILSSTFLTLMVIPSFYMIFQDIIRLFRRQLSYKTAQNKGLTT